MAEEPIQAAYAQYIEDNGGVDSLFQVGIGWNSTTTIFGRRGEVGTRRTTGTGENWVPVPSLGVNVVTALEVNPKASDGGANLLGGEDDMVLSAQWRE